MVGWWSGRELRALLERHEGELATVWPAVRDGGVPPTPSPRQVAGLGELLRAAGRSVDARGGRGGHPPEHAAVLLALALLHRARPAATPPDLRPLVDPTARVDAETVNAAGRMTAGFLDHARDEGTPAHLRRWCLDATLLCGTRCLSGSAPDDPRRAAMHELLSLAAEQRFRDGDDSGDEDAAIAHARAAHESAPPATPSAARACRLAELLTDRARRMRNPALLADAPHLARTALSRTDPASPEWLYFATRAMSTSIEAVLGAGNSVERFDEALELQRTVRRHPLYPRIRNRVEHVYADLLAQRFARRHDPEILDEAIEAYEELHAAQPLKYAAHLGRHLQYRYQLRGDTADRRRALDLMAEGLSGPDTSAEAVSSYGAAAMHEYRETGDHEVITRALTTVTRLTAPDGAHAGDFRPLRARCLLLLAHSEAMAVPDYGPVEEAARRTLEHTRSAADRGLALSLLATVLVHRCRSGGDPAVLDEAVHHCREGLAALPDHGNAELSDRGNTEAPDQLRVALVLALAERHTRTGHLASLRDAVDEAERLAGHMAVVAAELPVLLGNATSLLVRYARETKDSAQLDRAQRLVERAMTTTEPSGLAVPLGSVLLARAQLPDAGIEAAETVVRHYETALREAPADVLRRTLLYGNLSHALRERHRIGGDREDLDLALAAARKCLRLAPSGHPLRGGGLGAVSWVLGDIAAADGNHDAIVDQAIAVNAELAADPAQPPAHNVSAALRLAEVAHATGDTERALTAARAAIETLPLVVWRGADRSDQEKTLSETELGSLAAKIALAAGKPRDALELLEAGRGILAAQALELRTETEDLAAAAPELAIRFDTVRRALEQVTDDPSAAAADRRHRLAREWHETLDAIRARDGFTDFLRPPRAGQLLPAGVRGPVVVVTVSEEGTGHALLLDGTDLTVCPLPGLTHAEARERGELLFQAVAAAGRSGLARAFAEQSVGDLLEWLWSTVAEPVLDALDITGPPPPGQEPPRLWWCPSGPLTFLPLHAAGAVPDRVVSSYTPSLTALLRARDRAVPVDREPLIVAVPETPGQAPLPGALREAELAHRTVGGTLLSGDAAHADAVRVALAGHSWVHFACHGVQDPEQPSEGRLLLPGGTLSVRDMTRLRLPAAEFAYLSACETALGGTRLPDEALHLAGSLQLAGFSQVIGTLWRADDDTSAEIAEGVYGELAAAGPGAPPAALALHRAVRRLRVRCPERPLSWAAHVHSGA
ncbi:CHAT domain-containing protein [Streptomyces sp. NPDC002817]|uniref:CHAT domain-containing protein n=1 Tax=Streptomyces sp. NPDC088357 TaxID=3154655 RepID=UPI0034219759